MATSKSKQVFEAFAIIVVAVILIPIANQLAVDSNLTGTLGTIVTLLPVLLALVVVIAMFKDSF